MAIISTDSQYYTDIATAIRAKLGNGERLKPREMASAIGNIESSLIEKSITSNGTYEAVDDNADGYSSVSVNVVAPPPVLQTLSVSSNGSYTPPTGVDGFDEVTVTVTPSLQSKTVNQNGIITPDSGYDGLSQVTVNVQGGGDSYPLWTDIYDNQLPSGFSVENAYLKGPVAEPEWVSSASQNVQNFKNNECQASIVPRPGGTTVTVNITKEVAQRSLDQILSDQFGGVVEYLGYLYNTQLLTTYNMALLGDFSQNDSGTEFTLLDSIANYSAVALQGVYRKNRASSYNTTIVYPVDLNVERWTGMKDRNNTYDCYVTFTDNLTVSLSGRNKQVIIYGIL